MCYKKTCPDCGLMTWEGCGLHIDSALAGIPLSKRCASWKTASRCISSSSSSSSSYCNDILPTISVCIVGAGLAGSMAGALLSKLPGVNVEVSIYEKREDPRENKTNEEASEAFGTSASATKRSINLALSYRGQMSLKEIGLLEKVMETAVQMPGRVIHSRDGVIVNQAYGKPGEALYSVGRETINNALLDHVSKKENIKLFFNHSLVGLEINGNVEVADKAGKITRKQFDLVIGADGAYSTAREHLLKQGRINFSRDYIAHGYKELCIPPRRDLITGQIEYAIPNFNGLHIWPRGNFMLIALPNPDFSFTATLFAPYKGADGFDEIDASSKLDVDEYFHRYFPDVLELMPDVSSDFKNNPVGSLVTIRVNPWHLGRVLLVGDAAHAVVPFYGQGMNAAFEDCLLLYQELCEAMKSKNYGIEQAIEAFSVKRRPAANSLADLCLDHYNDMASSTESIFYFIGKKIEGVLHSAFPSLFMPLYTMVAFTNKPYHEAVSVAKKQDEVIKVVMTISAATAVIMSAFVLFRNYKS